MEISQTSTQTLRHTGFLDVLSTKSCMKLSDASLIEFSRAGDRLGHDIKMRQFFIQCSIDEDFQKSVRAKMVNFVSSMHLEGEINAENVNQHTGLLFVDIVAKDNKHVYTDYPSMRVLKKKLKEDQYVRLLFVNVRAEGLKIGVEIPPSMEDHAKYFNGLSNYFKEKYKVVLDPSGKNVFQRQILPFDEDAYLNSWNLVFTEKDELVSDHIIPNSPNPFLRESNVISDAEERRTKIEKPSISKGSQAPLVNANDEEDIDKGFLLSQTPTIPDSVFENLPGFLKSYFKHFPNLRSRDVSLTSLLGVLSAVLPKVFGIFKGNKFYTPLYVFVAAPAGTGKGVMEFSLKCIHPIIDYHQKEFEKEMKEYLKELNQEDHDGNDKPQKPKHKSPWIPGNSSSAKLIEMMKDRECVLIFETEADTLVIVMNENWGDTSDLFRKAYGHEPISIARKNMDFPDYIYPSMLSLVISGTFDQVFGLIPDAQNGLFSRMSFYVYDDYIDYISPFQNVFKLLDKEVEKVQKEIFELYSKLSSLGEEIEFQFTQEQIKRFDVYFSKHLEETQKSGAKEAIATVNRSQIIHFRIAMILTILKNAENLQSIMVCEDNEFETALTLADTYLTHALSMLLVYSNDNKVIKPNEKIAGKVIFDRLPEEFKTSDALAIGIEISLNVRSVHRYIAKWKDTGLVSLRDDRNGLYIKNSQ